MHKPLNICNRSIDDVAFDSEKEMETSVGGGFEKGFASSVR